MKRLFAIAALCLAPLAFADPTSTAVTQTTRHDSTGSGPALETFAEPDSAVKCSAAVAASGIVGTNTCKVRYKKSIVCPAAPASAQVVSCAPLAGEWSQTRNVVKAPNPLTAAACYTVGAWKPASAPTGKCTTPPPVSAVTWTKIANEGASMTFTTAKNVRYGFDAWPTMDVDPASTAGDVWIVKKLAAGVTYVCGVDTFGSDPKPGNSKQCQVSSEVFAGEPPPVVVPPPVTPPASSPTEMPQSPYVPIADASKWPKPNQNPVGGWSKDMLIATTEIAPTSDIGAFRTGCQLVGFQYNDPIVYPGQANKSHLHTFLGNTGIGPNSTPDSLLNSGNSTCRGGTINRSSYWVPSLIDMRTKLPIAPMFESNIYYKTGYAVAPSMISYLPNGLRMIAGDASGKPGNQSAAVNWACVWQGGNSNWQSTIPTECNVVGDSWLIMGIDFPQCWDGANLDSPDHKSHMANPVNVKANNTGNCPASHPVALPQLAYQILYQVKNKSDPANWRLSSDNYPTTSPAGMSGHADYMFAWKPDIVKAWTDNCDRAQKDCHSHLLGDGRAMVIP